MLTERVGWYHQGRLASGWGWGGQATPPLGARTPPLSPAGKGRKAGSSPWGGRGSVDADESLVQSLIAAVESSRAQAAVAAAEASPIPAI